MSKSPKGAPQRPYTPVPVRYTVPSHLRYPPPDQEQTEIDKAEFASEFLATVFLLFAGTAGATALLVVPIASAFFTH